MARKHNLASSRFGSGRCRGQSPEHGTPKLPRKTRRMKSAEASGGKGGTCRIDAHAKVRADRAGKSVPGKEKDQIAIFGRAALHDEQKIVGI